MTVIDDPAAFQTVLKAWMKRHHLRQREAAAFFGVSLSALQKWLAPAAAAPPSERSHRALMTLYDEDRVSFLHRQS
jgi:transcriptional regulator with XRE-family HTH domain